MRSYLDVAEAHSPHRQQARLVEERRALTEAVRQRMRCSLKGRLLLPLFDRVLHQTQVHTRERDTVRFELTRLFPPMRAMLGELGKRWCQTGLLDQPDDIFFLTLDQMATPLFALAGAVVTEVGGILSHGAIVAREYGIPAVMGVRGITAAIHTGQVLLVDGNRGKVQLASCT